MKCQPQLEATLRVQYSHPNLNTIHEKTSEKRDVKKNLSIDTLIFLIYMLKYAAFLILLKREDKRYKMTQHTSTRMLLF